MRLGSSILGGKPMRIPGIVDVYQVGDEWVARSWPKVQNQPNSAAQLLWRKRFKDAHATIKNFQGYYLERWRAIKRPVGKMWIDIAMTSIMRDPLNFADPPTMTGVKIVFYYSPTGYPVGGGQYRLYCNTAGAQFLWTVHGYSYRAGTSWDETLKWNDLGWICAKGKRPKKRWLLDYAGPKASVIGTLSYLHNGLYYYCFTFGDSPNGVTAVDTYKWTDPVTSERKYVLLTPPSYFPVTPWDGGFPI